MNTPALHMAIIIPCFNEENTIGQVIDQIPKKIEGIYPIQVFVVDDGSTDRTREIAMTKGAEVVSHKRNLGVGAAFHTGVEACLETDADIVVNMDGDGQFDPLNIPDLIAPILAGDADCTTASRFKDRRLIPADMPFIKKWGNAQMSSLISFLVGERFYDVSCGFRAYSKNTILKLTLLGQFTYTQEAFLDLIFKNCRIIEVPMKIAGTREFGTSRVAANIPKYAYRTLKIIIRSFRDYKPLLFFISLALACFLPSLFLGLFFFYHYLSTGQFSGQLWAGFTSGFLGIFSFVFFITGLISDMFVRIRKNQEYLIYLEKKKRYF